MATKSNAISLKFTKNSEGLFQLKKSNVNSKIDKKTAEQAGKTLNLMFSKLNHPLQPRLAAERVIHATLKPVPDGSTNYFLEFKKGGQSASNQKAIVIKLNEKFVKALAGSSSLEPSEKTPLNATFGLHAYAYGSASQDSAEAAKTMQSRIKYARMMHRLMLAGAGLLAILVGLSAGIVAAVSATIAYVISTVYTTQKIGEISGVATNSLEELDKLDLVPKTGVCDALPTEHSADTELWREKLIEAAQENIVISGNYCGGNSFIKFLDLIEKRMDKVEKLKVVVISSPKFLTAQIREKIQALQSKFPQRFSLVESPDILYVSPGIKQSTNHTKCMVIDYGKYFILGGSGIKDNFAETGLDDLSKEEFLQARGVSVQEEEKKTAQSEGLISHFIPGSFRDMDFVFSSTSEKNLSGSQVYKQMLLLAYRWEQYGKIISGENVAETTLDLNQLAAFKNTPTSDKEEELPTAAPHAGDSVTAQLLKTAIPPMKNISTTVPDFDNHPKKASKAAFKILASGPEQSESVFADKLLDKINTAQTRIVINHMYFHPTNEIFEALKAAANRGVKIQIITCGVYPNCPASHLAFGPRNRYNYASLMQAIDPEHQENLEVFEFQQTKKGSHKKVIVIDDHVIAGSSNLGYKSLVTTSDHELNFFVRSKEFAQETLAVCQVDINHSAKVTNFDLTIGERMKAGIHRVMAPMIG